MNIISLLQKNKCHLKLRFISNAVFSLLSQHAYQINYLNIVSFIYNIYTYICMNECMYIL